MAAIPITVKRLHDRDRSGRTLATIIVTLGFVGLFATLYIFLHTGQFGSASVPPRQVIYAAVFGPVGATVLHGLVPIFGFLAFDGLRGLASGIQHQAKMLEDVGILLSSVYFVVVGIWFFWEVGLRRGTVGPNRYGPDPLS